MCDGPFSLLHPIVERPDDRGSGFRWNVSDEASDLSSASPVSNHPVSDHTPASRCMIVGSTSS
jgi:hypothetical protein